MCNPHTPFSPTSLHLRVCNQTDPSQAWILNTTQAATVTLRSYPKLCIDAYGEDPSTQQPALAVMACDSSSANQRFTYGADQTLRRSSDGKCVDVTFCGDEPCDGDPLELYSCGSPHDNQNFVYDSRTGFLQAAFDNTMCVAACNP